MSEKININKLLQEGRLKHFSQITFYNFLKKEGEEVFLNEMTKNIDGYKRLSDILDPREATLFRNLKMEKDVVIRTTEYFCRKLYCVEDVLKYMETRRGRGRPKNV